MQNIMTNDNFHLLENKVYTQSHTSEGDECSPCAQEEQIQKTRHNFYFCIRSFTVYFFQLGQAKKSEKKATKSKVKQSASRFLKSTVF